MRHVSGRGVVAGEADANRWNPFHETPWNMVSHWAHHHQVFRISLSVRTFAAVDGAHAAYLDRRASYETSPTDRNDRDCTQRLARFGRVVIDLAHPERFDPSHRAETSADVRRLHEAFDALGDPDEAWSDKHVVPMAHVDTGTVLASDFSLTLLGNRQLAFIVEDTTDLTTILKPGPTRYPRAGLGG